MQETDHIFHRWYVAHQSGQRSVLATIVATEGSSYRKPGARMLVTDDGQITGAVSGGCVEKVVVQQAQSVLASGEPTVIEYDGRYRLGCNGTLFIFLELVQPANANAFWQHYQRSYQNRRSFTIATTCRGPVASQGSLVVFSRQNLHYLNGQLPTYQRPASLLTSEAVSSASFPSTQIFVQSISPAPQLYVIGSEADARHLSGMAARLGWQVTLVTHPRHPVEHPEGVASLSVDAEALLEHISPEARSAVVLMTHSYSRDLAYLEALLRLPPVPFAYLGLLGPPQRHDSLLSEVLERTGTLPLWLEEILYAPAGIDLGGELPAEVALSVLTEIKAVFAQRPVPSLRDKLAAIHEPVSAVR